MSEHNDDDNRDNLVTKSCSKSDSNRGNTHQSQHQPYPHTMSSRQIKNEA